MKYMVIEYFNEGQKESIYDRFHEKGRMLPSGLSYIDSWLEENGKRCFQLMETDDVLLFDAWVKNWSDLVNFEVVPLGDKPHR